MKKRSVEKVAALAFLLWEPSKHQQVMRGYGTVHSNQIYILTIGISDPYSTVIINTIGIIIITVIINTIGIIITVITDTSVITVILVIIIKEGTDGGSGH